MIRIVKHLAQESDETNLITEQFLQRRVASTSEFR